MPKTGHESPLFAGWSSGQLTSSKQRILSNITKTKNKRIKKEHTNSCGVDITPVTAHDVEKDPIVSVVEYRKILKDYSSSDEQILNIIQYLENMCRDVIRREIQTYVEENY